MHLKANLGGVEALLQEELLLLSGSQLLRCEVPVSRVHVQSTQLRCRCVALQIIRYMSLVKKATNHFFKSNESFRMNAMIMITSMQSNSFGDASTSIIYIECSIFS